jgi:hypothetical protein
MGVGFSVPALVLVGLFEACSNPDTAIAITDKVTQAQ